MKPALFIILALTAGPAWAQETVQIRFSLDSIGVIRGSGREAPIGTGFVLGDKHSLVTADHVVSAAGRYTFQAVRDGSERSELTIRHRLPDFDLAVLGIIDHGQQLPDRPFQIGDFSRLRPGDTVVYLGWNAPKNRVSLREAVISALGKARYRGNTVDFLEFIGEGIPGWSGGPVLDLDGDVVAVMHEAWTKRGVKGGRAVLVNRAFSVGELKLLKAGSGE